MPWHDNKWNGTFCSDVLDNSFCRILPRIDDAKAPDSEPAGQAIDGNKFPPCIEEGGAFLSPCQYSRSLVHKLKNTNPLYKDYLPGKYIHKPFSYTAVPFLWMMKGKASGGHVSERADTYGLDYKPDLEEEIGQLLGEYNEKNMWIQHPDNQKLMLESFFGCLKKNESLIFFYAKHTPLSEPDERVIIGVAKVKNVGSLASFEFPPGFNGYKGYPWDRCIEHSLTDKKTEGFLLPYHELIEKSKECEIDLSEYAVFAPDRRQFSYASELVEHDTAIDSLWSIAESLRKSESILNKTYKKELDWIENEISQIWNMRGAFPGMGSVLNAIGIQNGNAIAWELEKFICDTDGDLLQTNPWVLFDKSIKSPQAIIKNRGKELFNPTVVRIWKSVPTEKKTFYQLISRVQLNNDQAEIILKEFLDKINEVIENPYILYEGLRLRYKGMLSFNHIDKAVFPPVNIREAFPLDEKSSMSDNLDERRVRSCAVQILDAASAQGHSLLPYNEILERMQENKFSDDFPINSDILDIQCNEQFFQQEIACIVDANNKFFKLQSLIELKNIITQRISKVALNKKYKINYDWEKIVNDYLDKGRKADITKKDESARKEKAEALRILCNNRISVLVGPAGTGKTTLLAMFEAIDEIKKGGITKLAPTGKARVKMGDGAKTVAQFLIGLDRYDGEYGLYHPNTDALKDSSARNIIIDEASMLTEEMLAAIFDALGPMDRIILVGDYRQLPPIGTGRPFVDIVNLLKPDSTSAGNNSGYAELKEIMKQKDGSDGNTRIDVALSRCFGGEPQKEDIEVLQEISNTPPRSGYLRLEKWYSSKDFREILDKILIEELLDNHIKIDEDAKIKAMNRTLGAKDGGNYQYFNRGYSEDEIEKWQIISPVNGYGYGVKEINKFFQKTYRNSFIELAHNFPKNGRYEKRKIAKPKGNDNIVYGDKVISLKNKTWGSNQWIVPKDKREQALFFANGEVGVITGEFRGKDSTLKGEPRTEITFSTQPGYSYSFCPNEIGEEGKYPFELAYAITVHKSQGSGFNKVFFVLPSKCPILSRELLYTALTRQEDKIIILHQGEFRDFIRFSSSSASATAKRFTDLFFLPDIKGYNKKYYDARYINISERGEPMISKSEVIIANCLYKYKDELSYAYENKLEIKSSGRTVKPDFTIEHIATGKLFYWEHLGMMTLDSYREKWEKKKQGYLDDGFVLWTEADDDSEKVLILTEENPNGGIDSQYFNEIIKKYILKEGCL